MVTVSRVICYTTFVLLSFAFSIGPVWAQTSLGQAPLQKAIEQYRLENYEEALEIFKELYQMEPSTVVSFYLGLVYKQIGDYPKAKAHFLEALKGKPRVNDAYAELVEILYQLNQLQEAMSWIEEAEKLSITPSKITFLKGLTLSKMGRLEEARKSFENAKSLDPELTQAADFQIALTYTAERKIKEALKALENLIKIEPKTDVAEFAADYLKTLQRAFKEWNFFLSAGYQYDDNVVSKPLDRIGVPAVDEISRKGDSALVNSFKVNYRPLLESKFSLDTEAYLYLKTYSSLHEYDTILGSITISPGLNFNRSFLTFPSNFSHTWLNDKRYSENFSINPTFSFQIRPGHLTQLSAGLSKRRMLKRIEGADPDENRNSNGMSFSAGYYYPFKERGLVYLRYDYFNDDTSGRNWDSYTNKLSGGIVYPIAEKLNLQVGGDYALQNYKNIHTLSGKGIPGFPASPAKREDTLYSLTAGLLWEITKTVRLNGNYYYSRADSNFPIYDYRKNVYTLDLSINF